MRSRRRTTAVGVLLVFGLIGCARSPNMAGPAVDEIDRLDSKYCADLGAAVDVRDRLKGGLDVASEGFTKLTAIQGRLETTESALAAAGGYASPEGETAGAARVASARRYLDPNYTPSEESERFNQNVGVEITAEQMGTTALDQVENLRDDLTFCG